MFSKLWVMFKQVNLFKEIYKNQFSAPVTISAWFKLTGIIIDNVESLTSYKNVCGPVLRLPLFTLKLGRIIENTN